RRSRGSGGCIAIRTTGSRSTDPSACEAPLSSYNPVMLNVGLIGFGFSGKVFHAPVIRAVDGVRLTTIVQRSGTPDPRYSDVEFVCSVEELLTRAIELVVIATPNASHHPIA